MIWDGMGIYTCRASRSLINSAGVYHIKWWWGSILLVIARYVQSLVGRQGRGWMEQGFGFSGCGDWCWACGLCGGGGSLEERVVKEGYLWVGWDLMGARE